LVRELRFVKPQKSYLKESHQGEFNYCHPQSTIK